MKRSGVYKISFAGNNKVYVGSSVNIDKRKYEHKRTLLRGNHANRYLQRAFNKNGEKNLQFCVLEYHDDIKTLRDIEQKWVDFYNSADKEMGYNIVQDVNKTGTTGLKYSKKRLKEHEKRLNKMWNKRRKHYVFISPEGKTVKIFGLRQFCKKHGLHERTMYNVHNGIGNECMGWKKYYDNGFISNRKGQNFILKNTKENIIKGNNLRLFCKNNGINYDSLRKGYMSAGYILTNASKRKAPPFFLIYENKTKIQINNLRDFCRKNNINYMKLYLGKEISGYKRI